MDSGNPFLSLSIATFHGHASTWQRVTHYTWKKIFLPKASATLAVLVGEVRTTTLQEFSCSFSRHQDSAGISIRICRLNNSTHCSWNYCKHYCPQFWFYNIPSFKGTFSCRLISLSFCIRLDHRYHFYWFLPYSNFNLNCLEYRDINDLADSSYNSSPKIYIQIETIPTVVDE